MPPVTNDVPDWTVSWSISGLTTILPICRACDICLSASTIEAMLWVTSGSGRRLPSDTPWDTRNSAFWMASADMKSTASKL